MCNHDWNKDKKSIKMAVACESRSGIPMIFLTEARVTREEYDNAEHYEIGRENVDLNKYANADIVIDENDMMPKQWLDAFIHFSGSNKDELDSAIKRLQLLSDKL